MQTVDIIVIGSGAGGNIVDSALRQGYSVAWIDKGPLGGTCLNVGCIPSKMIIYPADRIMEIKEAKKLGISAEINHVDFQKIMDHMRQPIKESHEQMEQGLQKPIDNFQYYKGEGHFIDDHTIEINGKTIRGKTIFIGSGARPHIPDIKGLSDSTYLTNENVFDIKKKPESLIILGGGYISVEFAHFFSAMGTKVTILQRGDRLIKTAEPEIAEMLHHLMSKRMDIIFNFHTTQITQKGNTISVIGTKNPSKKSDTYTAEHLLIATGRTSNADLLHIENTGIELDERGYIKVNEYLETSKKHIYAFGDATGRYMFRHVANQESEYAFINATQRHKQAMSYHAIPFAVFTYPQIAGVGLTEQQARRHYDVLIGTAKYTDVSKGEAMVEQDGFTKAIVNKADGRILGFHIIGPYAPILIQEVINAMALGGNISFIGQGMHIHPALPEIILRTFGNLQ